MQKIDYADQATEVAINFIKRYFSWGGRPLSARKENGHWLVEVDVGAFLTRVGWVKLDAQTGNVLEYSFPKPDQPSQP